MRVKMSPPTRFQPPTQAEIPRLDRPSDTGLLASHELNGPLARTYATAIGLHDTRTGQNTQPSLLTLLRQLV